MLRRIGIHIRQNVVGYIALSIALGGTGAYASHLVVRSSDIVNNQIRSMDVRDDKLRGGGLTGVDIKEGTLRPVTLKFNDPDPNDMEYATTRPIVSDGIFTIRGQCRSNPGEPLAGAKLTITTTQEGSQFRATGIDDTGATSSTSPLGPGDGQDTFLDQDGYGNSQGIISAFSPTGKAFIATVAAKAKVNFPTLEPGPDCVFVVGIGG